MSIDITLHVYRHHLACLRTPPCTGSEGSDHDYDDTHDDPHISGDDEDGPQLVSAKERAKAAKAAAKAATSKAAGRTAASASPAAQATTPAPANGGGAEDVLEGVADAILEGDDDAVAAEAEE